jgi:hypothetical protein
MGPFLNNGKYVFCVLHIYIYIYIYIYDIFSVTSYKNSMAQLIYIENK